MKLIISLLVYNQLEVTKKCIESLLENSTSDYVIIISDNASNKETAKYLSSIKHKRVVYERNNENIGFIKAHNNIFNLTKSKYFCVLNNDIIVKTKGWDSKLIELLELHDGLAQVGPKQDFGYIDDSGTGKPRKGNPIDYIQGSCFIVARDYVSEVGGLFEEKYMQFAFCEDADLSLRLRNSGYKIAEYSGINILHFHHQSFKHEKVDIDFKKLEKENKEFLKERWGKYLKIRKFDPVEILVIRDGALGDAFLITPIIKELKNKYPQCRIFVQTKCPQGFINNPYIVGCGTDLRDKIKYDKIINLNKAYEEQPKKHIVDAYAEKAGVVLSDKMPQYFGLTGRTILFNSNPYIVVCSDNTWKNRMIPKETWKQFIQYIGKNHQVVEVGINPENYTGVGKNFIGKLSFQGVIDLIAKAELFVGNDSGLMHFAQSIGTPVFVFFGAINPIYRIHDWSKATVVKMDIPCIGCHHLLPPPVTFSECPLKVIHCCEDITVEHLINAFDEREIQ